MDCWAALPLYVNCLAFGTAWIKYVPSAVILERPDIVTGTPVIKLWSYSVVTVISSLPAIDSTFVTKGMVVSAVEA